MMKLDQELEKAGCDKTPEEFRELVLDLFDHEHPGRTYENLARHPRQAVDFCAVVRFHCGSVGKNLDESVIMGTLENCRKKGAMGPRQRGATQKPKAK